MAVDEAAARHAGPYRLLERLGEGGMGVVFRAVDEAGRQAAVKLLKPELARDLTFRRRLAREVDTMRRVRSSYVAEVVDADVAADEPYIATQFINGPALDDVVRDSGPLTGRALVRLASGLAAALTAIHEAGVVHRDLKPNNVMLVDGTPIVIDFGIAHAADATRLTQTGMIIGTPGYLAPEIIEGGEPGPGIDVYAWAATVAFAASGRSPFGTGSMEVVLARILAGKPDLSGVPPRMAPFLHAALLRDPTRRPSAQQLTAWLDGFDPDQRTPTVLSTPYPRAPLDATAVGTPQPVPASPANPPSPNLVTDPGRASTVAPRTRVGLGWYKLLAYLVLVVGVAGIAAMPVAGAIALVIAAWYLRAGDAAMRRGRVPIRGARDLVLLPARVPGSFGRANGAMVLCLLYAGAVSATVGGAMLIAKSRSVDIPAAELCQVTAAVFGYVTLAGPGMIAPRRQLVRLISALAPDRRATAIGGLGLACLAVIVLLVSWKLMPRWWPLTDPYDSLRQATDRLREAWSKH